MCWSFSQKKKVRIELIIALKRAYVWQMIYLICLSGKKNATKERVKKEIARAMHEDFIRIYIKQQWQMSTSTLNNIIKDKMQTNRRKKSAELMHFFLFIYSAISNNLKFVCSLLSIFVWWFILCNRWNSQHHQISMHSIRCEREKKKNTQLHKNGFKGLNCTVKR